MAEEDPLDLLLMWTGHIDVLLQVMQALREKELFADATLICGEKQYAVHKFVLSTCSSYLEQLFESAPGDHPVLILPDTPSKALEQLLDFMYLGQADLTSVELDQLLEVANELKIIGLIHPKEDAESQKLKPKIQDKVKKKKASPSKPTYTRGTRESPRKTSASPISQDSEKNSPQKKLTKVNKIINKVHQPKKLERKSGSHVCQICNAKYENSTLLQDHMTMHIDQKFLSCPECPFKTLTLSIMNLHINKHAVGRPYVCPYCQQRHPLEELHVAHQRRYHPKMQVLINKVPGLKSNEGHLAEHKTCGVPSEKIVVSSLHSDKNKKLVPPQSPVQQTHTVKNDRSLPPSASGIKKSNPMSGSLSVSTKQYKPVIKPPTHPVESTKKILKPPSLSSSDSHKSSTSSAASKTIRLSKKRKSSEDPFFPVAKCLRTRKT